MLRTLVLLSLLFRSESRRTLLKWGRSRVSGEVACEGHGYTDAQCGAVGCCHYTDAKCWSSVEKGACTAARDSTEAPRWQEKLDAWEHGPDAMPLRIAQTPAPRPLPTSELDPWRAKWVSAGKRATQLIPMSPYPPSPPPPPSPEDDEVAGARFASSALAEDIRLHTRLAAQLTAEALAGGRTAAAEWDGVCHRPLCAHEPRPADTPKAVDSCRGPSFERRTPRSLPRWAERSSRPQRQPGYYCDKMPPTRAPWPGRARRAQLSDVAVGVSTGWNVRFARARACLLTWLPRFPLATIFAPEVHPY
jgi:hypothetical protein